MKSRKIVRIIIEQRILVLIVALIVFLKLKTPYFLTFGNIVNILLAIAVDGIIVIGMAYLIIVGEIDLSVGSTMALSGVLGIVFQKFGVFPAVITGLVSGGCIGFINGLLVTKVRITSIAATLGMMIFLNGIVFAITKSQTLKGTNTEYVKIALTNLLKIPLPVYIFFILTLIFGLILKYSYFGRNVFAVGGNSTASDFFGLKVDRIKIEAFTLTGFLSGLAGVILAAKLNIASGIIGQNTPILVITAVLLGGISLSGGEGTVFKAFLGILFIGILNNALVLLMMSSFVQDVIRGALLIILLIIDSLRIKKMKYE